MTKVDKIAAGLWTFLAYFGLIMLAGAENAMSAYAGYNFGTHDLERYLYAAAYSGNELLKVALLWKLGQAFAQPGSLTVKALRIGVGALVLTPLVLLISLSGHVGFVGLVRGDTVAIRSAALVKTDDAAAVIKADQAQLDQMRTNRKWSASRQCTNATIDTTIAFCAEYRKVEKRLDAARGTLSTTAAIGLADPQVDILAMLFPGRETRELQLGLALLESSGAQYAFSVTSYAFPIQRAIRLTPDGRVAMFDPAQFNTRSQDLEEAFHDAGQFYWGWTGSFMAAKPLVSPMSRMIPIPPEHCCDINTEADWQWALGQYRKNRKVRRK